MLRYALIDASTRDDTPRALRYYTLGHRARCLFERQPEHALADLGPWLAALDDNSGLQNWLPALDLNAGAVAWLTAGADFDEVFRHLEACLDLTLPDGSQAMFRFWDGRVLARLHYVLTAEQKRELLGPVESWRVTLGARVLDMRREDLREPVAQ